MSIFQLSTGKQANEETSGGNFEMTGGSEPIPENTKVRAIITESKWDEYEGSRYIKLRWDVVDGEYKKRVIFQKLKVYESDAAKADRQRMMLAAIDANCGGKLAQVDGEPSDMDLTKSLTNKPMLIKLGVWTMNDKSGNWIMAVESGKSSPAAAAAKPKPAAKPAPEPFSEPSDGDDIPF